jgi:hypothetical protein
MSQSTPLFVTPANPKPQGRVGVYFSWCNKCNFQGRIGVHLKTRDRIMFEGHHRFSHLTFAAGLLRQAVHRREDG